MAGQPPESKYFKKLNLGTNPGEINFTKIGINLQNNIGIIWNKVRSVSTGSMTDNLKAKIVGQNTIFLAGSFIIIDEIKYTVIAHLGNGTYGATCKVQDTSGNVYALKEQDSDYNKDKRDYNNFINEAKINYIINCVTIDQTNNPFSAKIHKVFHCLRNDKMRIYCLLDILEIDGQKMLNECKADIRVMNNKMIDMFNQLIYKLKELFTMYQFNHGDLKPANIMYNKNGTLCLIDYGFSRMVIPDTDSNPIIIQTSDYNIRSNASKDLTLLAALTLYSFSFTEPYSEFINKINFGYGPKCNLSYSGVKIQECKAEGKKFLITDIGQMYTLCDEYDNNEGTFDIVIPNLERITKPHHVIPSGLPASTPASIPLAYRHRLNNPRGGGLTPKNKTKKRYRRYETNKGRRSSRWTFR